MLDEVTSGSDGTPKNVTSNEAHPPSPVSAPSIHAKHFSNLDHQPSWPPQVFGLCVGSGKEIPLAPYSRYGGSVST